MGKSFYSKGRNIPIRIKFNADDITDIHQLSETKILAGNYSVPISAIGTIKYVENEKIFYRYNRNEAKILQDFPAELDDIKNIIWGICCKSNDCDNSQHSTLGNLCQYLDFDLFERNGSIVVVVHPNIVLPRKEHLQSWAI